jgi:glycerophosphoryl diester phosphodiesterase
LSAWWTSPLVVGHRGGRGRPPANGCGGGIPLRAPDEAWPPENTLAAFDRARSEGARAVELDVRTCEGGEAVVLHDPTLARMTHSRDLRQVHEVPLAALHRVDLGGGARVPSLAEVLAWARDGGVAVNVEVKHDVPSRVEVVRATVRAVHNASADVLLSSFDPISLAMAALWAPFVPRALLTHAEQPLWAGLLQRAVRRPFVQAVHLQRAQCNAAIVAGCVRRGLRVGAWTVNDVSDVDELVRHGVATIITDVPGEVISYLAAEIRAPQSQ